MNRTLALILAAIAAALLMIWAASAMAQQQPSIQEQDALKKWIPTECCVSSNAMPAGTGCCFRIDPGDVTEIGDGKYRIDATGQVIAIRPSQDGNWYRCACDQLPGGGWVVHEKANTRCLYGYFGF